jgi:hypothetical protein
MNPLLASSAKVALVTTAIWAIFTSEAAPFEIAQIVFLFTIAMSAMTIADAVAVMLKGGRHD